MERESHNIRIIPLIAVLFIIYSHAFAGISEKEYFNKILRLAENEQKEELAQTAKEFFKEYPGSNLIADVRLILAEKEQDPDQALCQFRILVDKYRYFDKRDYAQYKVCEILYLQSKWNELEQEARKGISLVREGAHLVKYKFFLAKALIRQEEFDKAKEVCLDITETDHTYDTLSDALLLLSYINRNIYGMSGSYLYSLSEIISGFRESGSMPAALYMLGRYYESRAEYDKAYSAYTDLVNDFPRSPESESSRRQLEKIARYNPVKTAYMPDKEKIRNTDIDIQPEIDISDEAKGAVVQYSISLGPFYSINNAKKIKELIENDFQPVEIIRLRNAYSIHAGRFVDTDSAVNTKIRLAEEFGINGNIVKIVRQGNNIYRYEE
jgi:tetratricopeptide (TPR) repeat protein